MNNQVIISATAIDEPFYRSKKFWYAIAVSFAAASKEMGVEIPPEALYAGLALILGQGLADLSKNAPKQTTPNPVAAPAPASLTQTTAQSESSPSLRVEGVASLLTSEPLTRPSFRKLRLPMAK